MSIIESIRNFFKSHIIRHFTSRTALILVVCCCAVSLLWQYFRRPDAVSLVSVAGAFVVPFQEGVNEIGKYFFDTDQEYRTLEEARQEVDRLKKDNERLIIELAEMEAKARNNEDLRALLEAKKQFPEYHMVAASVIGNDGVNVFERFTIDLGSADGIAVNMNVLNGDGLIGIVTYVGLNYSIVTTLIEEGMNVSAMTKNGHENCIVTGDMSISGQGLLRLDNVLSSVDLSKDGTLVTSNISDRFLPNLLIGYAKDVEVNNGNLTQSGYVLSAVDFTRIQEVLVITDLKQKPEDAK